MLSSSSLEEDCVKPCLLRTARLATSSAAGIRCNRHHLDSDREWADRYAISTLEPSLVVSEVKSFARGWHPRNHLG